MPARSSPAEATFPAWWDRRRSRRIGWRWLARTAPRSVAFGFQVPATALLGLSRPLGPARRALDRDHDLEMGGGQLAHLLVDLGPVVARIRRVACVEAGRQASLVPPGSSRRSRRTICAPSLSARGTQRACVEALPEASATSAPPLNPSVSGASAFARGTGSTCADALPQTKVASRQAASSRRRRSLESHHRDAQMTPVLTSKPSSTISAPTPASIPA